MMHPRVVRQAFLSVVLAATFAPAQERVLNKSLGLPEILHAAPSGDDGALVLANRDGVFRTIAARDAMDGVPLVRIDAAAGERLVSATGLRTVARLTPDGTGRYRVEVVRINESGVSPPVRLRGRRGIARARRVWLGDDGPLILTRSDGRATPTDPDPVIWRFWRQDGRPARQVPHTDPMKVHVARGGGAVALRDRTRIESYDSKGAPIRRIDGYFRYIAMSNDGNRALLARGMIDDSEREQLEKLMVLGFHGDSEFDFHQPIHGVAISPDGHTGLVWLKDRTLVHLDIHAHGVTRTWLRLPYGRKVFISRAHVDDRGDVLLLVKTGREASQQRVRVARIRDHRLTHVGTLAVQQAARSSPRIDAVLVDRIVVENRGRLTEVVMTATPTVGTLVVQEPTAPDPPEYQFQPLSDTVSTPALWPLVPQTEQHPVGTGLEFQSYGFSTALNTIHDGIDVMARDDDGELKDIAVTVSGVYDEITSELDGPVDDTFVLLTTVDRVYEYGHIDAGDLFDDTAEHARNGDRIPTGTVLGTVGKWPTPCGKDRDDFDHLHYTVKEAVGEGLRIDPLTTVTPYLDDSPPEVHTLLLCPDDHGPGQNGVRTNRSQCSELVAAGSCVAVDDKDLRDLVVEVSDRGTFPTPDGHLDTLGFHALTVTFCRTPGCEGVAPLPYVTFDRIPGNWTNTSTKAGAPLFLGPEEFNSTTNYCDEDTFRYVATNVVDTSDGPEPSSEGSWDPSSLDEGFHTMRIAVRDYKGNETRKLLPVCVHPSTVCRGKLIPRDCEEDLGVEPSECPDAGTSPDIAVVPPDDESDGGYLELCLKNVGCGAIPSTDTIEAEFFAVHSATGKILDNESAKWSAGGFGSEESPETWLGSDWGVGEIRCRRKSIAFGSAFTEGEVTVEAGLIMGDDVPADVSALEDNNRASVKVAAASIDP